MGQHWICAVAICFGLSSQVVAEERPKAGLVASASCMVVRYYVAKYTRALKWALAKTTLGTASTNPNCPVSQIDNSKGVTF